MKREQPTINARHCYRVRYRTGLAQRPFAKLVGIGIASVLKYEKAKAIPEKTPLLIYKMLQEDPDLIKMMFRINGHKLTPNEYKRALSLCKTEWVKFKPVSEADKAHDDGRYQEYLEKQKRIRERQRSLGIVPDPEPRVFRAF